MEGRPEDLDESEAIAAMAGDDAWVAVERKGNQVWAIVNLKGGAKTSSWPVTTPAEVEDIAARFGIRRHSIRGVETAFADPD